MGEAALSPLTRWLYVALALHIPGAVAQITSGSFSPLVHTAQVQHFAPDRKLDLIEGEHVAYSPSLKDAIAHAQQFGTEASITPLRAVDVIGAEGAIKYAPFNGQVVQIDGDLLETVERAQTQTLLLKDGPISFQAVLQGDKPDRVLAGSRVRLTGVCNINFDSNGAPRGFSVLLRSPGDLFVLRSPLSSPWGLIWPMIALMAMLALMGRQIIQMRQLLVDPTDMIAAESSLLATLDSASWKLGLAGGLIGLVVLTGGWIGGLEILRALVPNYAPMKANTAIGMVLLGSARTLDRAGAKTWLFSVIAACCCISALSLGAFTVLEYATGINFHIDEFFFRDTTAGGLAGRMAVQTALNFMLLGFAMSCFCARRFFVAAQLATLGVAATCLLNLMGYLYGARALYGNGSPTAMAVHTSAAFMLLSASAFLARPDQGLMRHIVSRAPGGVLARRLLIPSILVPAILGWLCRQGQLIGLYDTEFRLALYTSMSIAVLTFLIWVTSGLLNRMDIGRSRAEESVRILNDDLEDRVRRRTAELTGAYHELSLMGKALHEQALILDMANDTILIRDREDQITYWNQGAERLYGWNKEEALGHVTHSLLKTNFPQPLAEIKAWLLEKGHWRGELLHRRKDGSQITVASNWTFKGEPTNGTGSVLEINTDITPHKRSENELKNAIRRLSLATDALKAGVWDWDIRTNEIVWDERMCEIYGLPPDTQIDYQVWVNAVVPDDLPGAEATLRSVIDQKSQASMMFRIALPNGSLRYIQAAEGVIVDDAGQVLRVIGINIDTTDRRFNEDLERQVSERTADLKAANKELEEFAYVASHDLKAPLRVIDNASKWLEEDLEEHLTAESRENLALLRGRVKRMERLLDDLLEYARIGRTTDKRFSHTIPGNVLLDDVLSLVALGEFTFRVSPRFAGILVCRMPLQQIFVNLIGNSIKHHDKKTGVIEVTVEDEGDYYAFAVKDDGPGIHPRFHNQIFKMFQTLRPRDQVEGSGMGLAMVRKNVETFGGSLQLQSAEGHGSVFRFTWPKEQRVRRVAA